MGDFNAPAEIRGEGYDYVEDTGWYDTFPRAQEKVGNYTFSGLIDGWEGEEGQPRPEGLRIDYVWCSVPVEVTSARVVFDGGVYPVVSDHYGVLVEIPPRPMGGERMITWDDLKPDTIFEPV